MTVLPSHTLRLVKKKLMPLSRPIRNLTKFTQIPHLASGMLLQDLPCLVPSSSNCRNRLQSCSLRGRRRFWGGGQKEKYRCRARVSGEAKKARANEPPNLEKDKNGFYVAPGGFTALALHPTLSLFAHPSQTNGGS